MLSYGNQISPSLKDRTCSYFSNFKNLFFPSNYHLFLLGVKCLKMLSVLTKSTSLVLSHKSISEVYSVAYLTSSLGYIIDVQANINKIELLLLPAPYNLLLSQYFPPRLRAIPFFQFSHQKHWHHSGFLSLSDNQCSI